jgi:hypothetical protein
LCARIFGNEAFARNVREMDIMSHTLCAVKWQCELAVREIAGHGGWEKMEWDVYIDRETNRVVPVICALKEGNIYLTSGEGLQKFLDEFFPLETQETLKAFTDSLQEHRRTEAEHKEKWGDRLQNY